jgi:hypothetical protein
MVSAFADQGVTSEMLAERLGHKLDVTTEPELVQLRRIFTSLRDGMAKREQFFKLPVAGPQFATGDLPPDAPPAPPPAPKPVTPPPAPSAQARLAELVLGGGFTFEDFRQWAHQANWIEDVSSLGSFEDVPAKTAERFLKARKGLLDGLAQMKGGRHE